MLITSLLSTFLLSLCVRAEDPVVLHRVGTLGPGASKENSGIVRGKAVATTGEPVFWTINDSGDEPRLYAVRSDGRIFDSERYPKNPGVLVGGAINVDWEDIGADASGHIIIPDFGNNSNARSDLTLYFVSEPEPTEGRTSVAKRVNIEYPDQRLRPAPRHDFNFDAEAFFTVGTDCFILTKHRSDTWTKLYRLDLPASGQVTEGASHSLTYIDRFDVKGQVTGADCTPDGLRLAVITYDSVWVFMRRDTETPWFSSTIRRRAYTVPHDSSPDANNKTQCEAICFKDPETLLIADEEGGELFELAISELPVVSSGSDREPEAGDVSLRVMSFNIRYGTAKDGENHWDNRRELVAETILREVPDLVATQESLHFQNEWLAGTLPHMTFHGAGRADGKREDEFSGIWYRRDRFTLLASGHFWLSETPDVPGSKSWDSSLPRMASWVRLHDVESNRAIVVASTHFDHQGTRARAESTRVLREQLERIAGDDPVIIGGDFNMAATHENHALLLGGSGSGFALVDTFDASRAGSPTAADGDVATFNGFQHCITGERIDWILCSPELRVRSAEINRMIRYGRLPSDHYPVTAVVQLPRR